MKWHLIIGGAAGLLTLMALRRRAGGSTVDPDLPRPPPEPDPDPPLDDRVDGVSPAGVRFIAEFEGFSAKLYNDAAGHCTIGFGHLVHRGPCSGNEPATFREGLTREQALGLLADDIGARALAVARLVTVPLSQHQFDALVSFAFNVGLGAFEDSTLLRRLNDGDYASVPKELMRWVYAGGRKLDGLVRRRTAEGQLFSDGEY